METHRPADRLPPEDPWEGVRAVLVEVLDRPEEAVTPDASLEAALGVDSLAMIEIAVRLEERFGIAFPPSASPADLSIETGRDLARFVAQRVAAEAA